MSAQSRATFGAGGEWIFDVIKRNPEGLLLLAAGAVLMMRTNVSRPDRSDYRNFSAQTAEHPQDAAGRGHTNHAVRSSFLRFIGVRCRPANDGHGEILRLVGIRLCGQGATHCWRAIRARCSANPNSRARHLAKSAPSDCGGGRSRGRGFGRCIPAD